MIVLGWIINMNDIKFKDKVNVLDHGYVRLVDHMGTDLSIVRSARVSHNAEWRTGEDEGKDEKLISYLMKNNHTTPFEAMTFTFEVKAPIFVVRQWHRHRTWSYNEVSARYTELPEEFYVPKVEHITTQSAKNKQMRTSEKHPKAESMRLCMSGQNRQSFELYKELINAGCPRELARTVLPMATYTHMFATVNLHNLFHFIRLREHPHAQWEIQQYAHALKTLARTVVPVSVNFFDKYNSTE